MTFKGSSGRAGPGAAFVYREGGVTSGNLFSTFLGAYQAAAAAGVPATIYIDGSLGPGNSGSGGGGQGVAAAAGDPVSGACGTIDLSNINLEASPERTGAGGSATNFTFQTGTIVTGFRKIRGLWVMSNSSSAVLTLSSGTAKRFVLERAVLESKGSASMVHITNTGAAFPLIELEMGNDSQINNGAIAVFSIDAGAWLFAFCYGGAVVQSASCSGAGNASFDVLSASASVPATMPSVTSYSRTLHATVDQILPKSGITSARPTGTAIPGIGFQYFDTTLGIPIFWNGTVWKNASGTTV